MSNQPKPTSGSKRPQTVGSALVTILILLVIWFFSGDKRAPGSTDGPSAPATTASGFQSGDLSFSETPVPENPGDETPNAGGFTAGDKAFAETPTAGADVGVTATPPSGFSAGDAAFPQTDESPTPENGFSAGEITIPATATLAQKGRSPTSPPATAPPTRRPTRTPSPVPATPTRPPRATPTPATQIRAGPAGMPVLTLDKLPRQAIETLKLIGQGGPFPYDRDGITFENREGLLPRKSQGYYREYTVETPGSSTRGARRVIMGRNGELYYTDDHYDSFSWIQLD